MILFCPGQSRSLRSGLELLFLVALLLVKLVLDIWLMARFNLAQLLLGRLATDI